MIRIKIWKEVEEVVETELEQKSQITEKEKKYNSQEAPLQII